LALASYFKWRADQRADQVKSMLAATYMIEFTIGAIRNLYVEIDKKMEDRAKRECVDPYLLQVLEHYNARLNEFQKYLKQYCEHRAEFNV